MKITKELLEKSLLDNEEFRKMVCKNKYGHEDYQVVIDNVIKKCNITEPEQIELLKSEKFIPAGSILSACNTDNKTSLSNCYYIPICGDSIEHIYDAHKEIARTFSYRGGVGTDITVLRPKNAKVNNTAKTSSGAVSFMPSLSELTKTICQNGRRGALLISLDVRHPDTLDFIWSKAKPEKVFEKDLFTGDLPNINNANITLKLIDSFLQAVENDELWYFYFPDIDHDRDLYDKYWDGDYDNWESIGGKVKIYESLPARDVLNSLSKASWICGDPGAAFIDNYQNNTFGTYIHNSLKPKGFNACQEEPMSPYSNCLLGAFVLYKYAGDKGFNTKKLKDDVATATRVMNRFSDINAEKHPLQKQKDIDFFGKRIGLEFTGLGDLFSIMGFQYGDTQSLELLDTITYDMLSESIRESIQIAKENGPCKALEKRGDREKFIENCTWQKELLNFYKDDILEYGMANTDFTVVGPTGSLSIIAGNCTSGIEPMYMFSYKRKNRIDNKEYTFIHSIACERMLDNIEHFDGLTLEESKKKLNYVEAHEIAWKDRINVQASAQKNITSSISSTINLHKDTPINTIQDIYKEAWKQGLKGVTIFRDGCKEGVLSSVNSDNESVIDTSEIYERELLDVESAERHRVNWKKSKVYVSVSLDENDQPIEVFTKLPIDAGKNNGDNFNPAVWMERSSQWDCISRLTSTLFRYGVPLDEIIEQLRRSSYSMTDAAGILRRVLIKYKEKELTEDGEEIGQKCPNCGEMSYTMEGGCGICRECSYSTCG